LIITLKWKILKMKSPKDLNYEIRPCKFAERRMLLSSFARIIGVFKQQYQYIGFGGLSFTDFKLFHKELHINDMYSIEGRFSEDKLEFNKPYSCISILHGYSTDMLSSIDLAKPSIVWLDYDGVLSKDIFLDLELVLHSVPRGSIYLISCNRQLRKEGHITYTNDEFKEIYGSLVPFDIQDNCCADSNSFNTIKRMIDGHCSKVLNERNKLGENLMYKPLYNILYGEHRGARMFTCGGIVLDKQDINLNLNLEDLEYVSQDIPYEINIPNLTYRESNYLNQILGLPEKEQELIDRGVITKDEIEKYKKTYKFMPNFYDVRL